MADHADHIHVGFEPAYGANPGPPGRAVEVLTPRQWTPLLAQLRRIENPAVATTRTGPIP
jgi:hypothetical protein